MEKPTLKGIRTYLHIFVAFLGAMGMFEKIGGEESALCIVDTAIELYGLVMAAYFRYKA